MCNYYVSNRANIANLRVVAGEHQLSVDSGLEQNRNVASVSVHPRYNSATYEDDISLIFVSFVSLMRQ